ncbi:MAG: BON domain-containing protein [Verrucomicrobiales bacterium]|nr:BON domain-containing protein [Verrucomicrobiales bacterium]
MKCSPNFLSLLASSSILLSTGLWTGCMTNASSDRTAEQNREDGTITTRVKAALATDPQYKYDGVIVSTFHSHVQLSGFVDSEAQKDQAGEITEKVAGVKKVDNKISLKKPTQ